ncbi:hypothetical protein HZA99_04705 [Candidatus Woesearchaeota archaeon]|nr:hypothetical protein [Candidatus Woesearchaeota archaeon]
MELKITDSDILRSQLLEIKDFDQETKRKISESDILIIPNQGFRGNNHRFFYEGTSDFLKLARQELNNYSVALCENEGSEKSLTLHSGEIWIPVLMVSIDPLKDVVLPTIINFVSSYIFYKFSKDAKEDKVDVHLKIIVEDKKTKVTKSLSYDGKVSGLKSINIDAKKMFSEK